MNSKKIVTGTVIVSGIAAILHTGANWIEAFLTYETLPEWAIIATMGTTVGIYSSMMTIVVISTTIILAVGAGYYFGQEINALSESRQLIGAMVAGSAIGTSVITTGLLIYVGEFAALLGSSGWEGSLMHLSTYASLFFEIGLFVTIAMFAGTALAHTKEQNPSAPTPVDAPIDDEAPPDSNRQDDSQLTSAST